MAKEFFVTLKNKTTLKGWYWEALNPKVILTFIPGMDEYAYRYNPLMEYFNSKGISVYGLDILGQGLNVRNKDELERWPIDGFNLNVEAIHEMNMLAKKHNLPVVQLGHSMGSLLTQRRLELYPNDTIKTILMGTDGGQRLLMKFGFLVAKILVNKKNWNNTTPRLQAYGLKKFSKKIKNPRTKYDWISYNPTVVDEYINDPYCAHDNTCGFWKEFIRGMAKLWDKKEMKKISNDERIYITSGMDDGHGRYGKGPRWLIKAYKKLGIKEVRFKFYPNMRHEIVHEDDKKMVYEDLADEILNY